MQREGSAVQRALSQRALSIRGAGTTRMARLAASLAGSLSRTLSRADAAPDLAEGDSHDVLPLAIAMLVCGTRGDVQVPHA